MIIFHLTLILSFSFNWSGLLSFTVICHFLILLTEGAQTQNITLISTTLPLEGVCSFPFVGTCKILDQTLVDTKTVVLLDY